MEVKSKYSIKRSIKACALAVAMIIGVLSPVKAARVNAEDEKASVYFGDPKAGYDFYSGYTTTYTVSGTNAPSGVSYDEKTQTLTLNNCNQEKLVLNAEIKKGDFIINVKGDNKLLLIAVETTNEDSVETYNIKITGDGTLTVNPNAVDFNDADDGFFMHHILCEGAIFVDAEYQNTSLSIDENVNLNAYSYVWKEYDYGKTATMINRNSRADKKAIEIKGNVSDIDIEPSKSEDYENVRVETVTEDSGVLCRKKGYEKYCYYKDLENGMFEVYAIHDIMTNHCYTDSIPDWTVPYDDFEYDYEVLTNVPEDLQGKSYVAETNGKAYITVYLTESLTELWGVEGSDSSGKKCLIQDKTDYIESSETYEYYYNIYSLEDGDILFYEPEMYTYYLKGKEAETQYMSNPVKTKTWTGNPDSSYEHLEGTGYSVKVNATYYTNAIYTSPLVITSKNPKPVTPTPTASPEKTQPVDPSPTPTATASPEKTPEVKKGTTDTDEKTGATYTVTKAENGKVEVEYKAAKSSGKKVTIPSKVEVNGVEAKVTSVSKNAFANNKKIEKVTIPASVTKIGSGAFKNCAKLSSVTIPKGVTEISSNAFSGCKKLKTITVKSTSLKKVGKNAFKSVPKSATAKLPKKQKKAYKKLFKSGGYKGKYK